MGRLLIEVTAIRDFDERNIMRMGEDRVICRLGLVDTQNAELNEAKEQEIDLKKGKNLLTTQLPIKQIHSHFKLGLFFPMLFRPDTRLGILTILEFTKNIRSKILFVKNSNFHSKNLIFHFSVT